MKDFLSGILIALGAFVYLNVGGVAGALLFSFGIISIVKLNISLYTGVAGTDMKIDKKGIVLIKNIIGAMAASILLIFISSEDVIEIAQVIAINKVNSLWYVSLIKAIFCGVIVDVSVFLSKKENNSTIPLLIGIPVFILSGFNHSIADVSYLIIGATKDSVGWNMYLYYIICIIGNYIGCNIRNIFTRNWKKV